MYRYDETPAALRCEYGNNDGVQVLRESSGTSVGIIVIQNLYRSDRTLKHIAEKNALGEWEQGWRHSLKHFSEAQRE